jgi:hypothetical protein
LLGWHFPTIQASAYTNGMPPGCYYALGLFLNTKSDASPDCSTSRRCACKLPMRL